MKKLLKTLFSKLIAPMLRIAMSPFFDKRYLRGRYFDCSLQGWQWAWRSFWLQKVLGFNRHVPWPVSPFISVLNPHNIIFDCDDINNFQTIGCYFRASEEKIIIGKGSYIAPGVGVITANHDLSCLKHSAPGQAVVIGENCWVGMNSVILPGVTLGPQTVVGAGSVVTKSFPEGKCIIAGVPAKLLRHLDDAHD